MSVSLVLSLLVPLPIISDLLLFFLVLSSSRASITLYVIIHIHIYMLAQVVGPDPSYYICALHSWNPSVHLSVDRLQEMQVKLTRNGHSQMLPGKLASGNASQV